MAILGSFAGELFEVSDQKIFTPDNIRREEPTRWSSLDVMMNKPVSEFLGPGLGKITFRVILNRQFCDNVMREMDKWLAMARAGVVGTLIIGKPLGVDSWKLLSVSQAWNQVAVGGQILTAQLDLSFEEYLSGVWLNDSNRKSGRRIGAKPAPLPDVIYYP